MNQSSPDNRQRHQAERHLSQFAITIEITLISVMVGVVIFPLMDFATPLLRDLKFEYWLYILCGTLIVIDVWAEVIVHTLSIVGWPLDLVRNSLYIGVAVVLAILMHFLSDPRGWFALSALAGVFVVIIAGYDLTLIEQKQGRLNTSVANALFDALARRQRRALGQGVAYLVLMLAAFALIILFPTFFIEQHGHLIWIVVQTAGTAFILLRTIGDFKVWSEPILRVAMEELRTENDK